MKNHDEKTPRRRLRLATCATAAAFLAAAAAPAPAQTGGPLPPSARATKHSAAPTFPALEFTYMDGDRPVTGYLALDEIVIHDPNGGAENPVRPRAESAGRSGALAGAVLLDVPGSPSRVTLRTDAPMTRDGLAARINAIAAEMPGVLVEPVFYTSPHAGRQANEQRLLTRELAVQLRDGAGIDDLAARYGFESLTPINFMDNAYMVTMPAGGPFAALDTANAILANEPDALLAIPQVRNPRQLRFVPNDQFYTWQWQLNNTGQFSTSPPMVAGEDVNITGAWGAPHNATGAGVNIAIVDDGVEVAHEDLAPNARTDIDIDILSGDNDPTPTAGNHHGTACAGIAAARGGNNIGVTGAAPQAGIVGIRLLPDEGSPTDGQEAQAMAHQVNPANAGDRVHISSNSWGPFDDAGRTEGPGTLTRNAIANGIANGRGGLGTIYVWAGGNGECNGDNPNNDGYANSIYTIAVGASGANGQQSYYSEAGACILVNTPSSYGSCGGGGVMGTVTVDTTGPSGYGSLSGNNNYSAGFGGTSSACPLAAGVVALMLDVNPGLTWRDVQHILVETSARNHPASPSWITNGAGYEFSPRYGHGRVDAGAAVNAAASWTNVPAQELRTATITPNTPIPDNNPTGVTFTIPVTAEPTFFTEHVVLRTNISHTWRGDLEIDLVSPDGTVSVLAINRPSDWGNNYSNWDFMSVAHWGENPDGDWTVTVRDTQVGDTGTVVRFDLLAYGHLAGPPVTAPTLDSFSVTDPSAPTAGYSSTVTLDVAFTTGGDAATSLELAENAAFINSTVVPLPDASVTYTLANQADGTRTIYARASNTGGDSNVLASSITLDRTAPEDAGGAGLGLAGSPSLDITNFSQDLVIEFNEPVLTVLDGGGYASGLHPDAVTLSSPNIPDLSNLSVSVVENRRAAAGPFTISVTGTMPNTGDLTIGIDAGKVVDQSGNPLSPVGGVSQTVSITANVGDWQILN